MTPKQLASILDEHLRWLESDGTKGRQAILRGLDLTGHDLSRSDLTRASLEETVLDEARLEGAVLEGACLKSAQLNEAHAEAANFKGANLYDASCSGADFRNSIFENADLSGASLVQAQLGDAKLSNAKLQGANLSGANLEKALLNGSNLAEAQLKDAVLKGANLEGADLTKARMPKADLKETILEKSNAEGAILNDAKLCKAQLADCCMEDAQLVDAKLLSCDLRRANLCGADLTGSELSDSDFRDANLRGAQLERASFEATRLHGAILRDADLQDANLGSARGLLGSQLAGANVTGATLPDAIKEFAALGTVAESSKTSRQLFLTILLGCFYCWLTIGTTRDAKLLTNSTTSPLPIIGTEIPIVGFYWAGPILLLGAYLYFHLYLQRLWEGLSNLPAIFPDGRTLDERAHPWLLVGLVRRQMGRLHARPLRLMGLQFSIAFLLAWCLVPISLVLVWGRYLPRHDWRVTTLHIVLVVVSAVFGGMSYSLSRATLRGESWTVRRLIQRPVLTTVISGGLLLILSLGAIEGIPTMRQATYNSAPGGLPPPQRWVPLIFERLGYRTNAKLYETDVSEKPASWTGREEKEAEELPLVKGAMLAGRDLRYAEAQGAFLVKAVLAGADLSGADLRRADLRHADLRGAVLEDTDLRGADLLDAKGLTAEQLRSVRSDTRTRLP